MKSGRKLFSVALVAGIALAGCGGSSSGGGGGGGATTSTSPSAAAAGTPIKVGVICSCSGSFGGAFAPIEHAYEAFVKTVNASGGINGHPVDLTVKDDGGDPAKAATAFNDLKSAGVVAITQMDLVNQAWMAQAATAKIPVIGSEGGVQTAGPMSFPPGTTTDQTLAETVTLAKLAGAKKIADLYCAESPVCAQGVPYLKQAAGPAGLSVVYTSSISATAPNYTAQCLAARQAGADFMTVGSQPSTIIRVVQDCSRQGYNPTQDIGGAQWNHTMANIPAVKKSVIYQAYDAWPFFDDSVQGIKDLNAAFEKYYPGERNNQAVAESTLVDAWISGLMLQKAVETENIAASDEVTSDDIVKGLYTFKDETLGGLTVGLTFTPGKAHSVGCYYTAKVVNGTPQILNDGKTTCPPAAGG